MLDDNIFINASANIQIIFGMAIVFHDILMICN